MTLTVSEPAARSDPTPAGTPFHLHDCYVSFLLHRKDATFYFKAYPGNSGDSLIYRGTEILFARLGLRQTLNPAESDVIVIPGGNPSMWPSSGSRVWKDVWLRFPDKDFVIGPAGFQSENSRWKEAILHEGRNVVGLFARDPMSLDVLRGVQGLPESVELGLAHDPAFHLADSDWLATQRKGVAENHVLLAFRDDHEAGFEGGERLPLERLLPGRAKRAFSRLRGDRRRSRRQRSARRITRLEVPFLAEDVSRHNPELFLERIRESAEVHTDRLHVMIFAALLGKPVYAYPTRYNKLEMIYEHSMREWANVNFVSDR